MEGRAVARASVVRLSEDARAFLRASFRDELRSRTGVLALVASVLVAAIVLGALYTRSEREARDEKERAATITKTLLSARGQPQSKVASSIEELVAAKHACERELARCSGDAGP
jgi:hypothetical protein